MNSPDQVQQEVIKSTASPILAVASPGAGKTATLIWRVQHLIQSGVKPSQIVVISYTNAAANEVQARVGEEIRLGYVGTLHSFILHLLQVHGHLVGFNGRITVLDEDGADAFLTEVIARSNYRGTKKELFEAISKGPGPASKSMTRLQILVHDFYQSLITSNMATFDSILIMGEILLDSLPIQSLTCDGRNAISHLFVDEAQDCSTSDAAIFNKLPIESKCFFADADQAIFSFRGGNIAFVLDLARRSTVFRMENNYRSDQKICEIAQRLIEHNTERIDKNIVSKSSAPGAVEVAGPFATPVLELNFLAKQIVDLEVDPSTCAILTRTNALSREISDFLKALGIKVAEKESLHIPDDWAKCRFLISLLANPQNDFMAQKWMEMTAGPDEAKKASLEASRNYQSLNDFCLHIPIISDLKQLPDLLQKGGFSSDSIALVSKISESMPPGSDLPSLTIALGREIHHRDEIGEGIVVSTLHSSKGREFSVVFLPCFEDEVIPGTRKSTVLEEERRLAYVGMTRAKHRLVFSYSKTRKFEWGPYDQPVKPSRFLQEALI